MTIFGVFVIASVFVSYGVFVLCAYAKGYRYKKLDEFEYGGIVD